MKQSCCENTFIVESGKTSLRIAEMFIRERSRFSKVVTSDWTRDTETDASALAAETISTPYEYRTEGYLAILNSN